MRILELISDDKDRLSTPASVVWVGVLVLSAQIIIDAINLSTNETVIGIYAGLIGSVYGIKKVADSSVDRATVKAQGDQPDIKVNNIEKVTTDGDVNINQRSEKDDMVAGVLSEIRNISGLGLVLIILCYGLVRAWEILCGIRKRTITGFYRRAYKRRAGC